MPSGELEYELLMNPLGPGHLPKLHVNSWGISINIRWVTTTDKQTHKKITGWHVITANLDSPKGDVTSSWVPNGEPPEFEHTPLMEYLEKLERLFGIS